MKSYLTAPLTIDDVKTLLPGVSERALRETIRRHKCYSMIGGKMYLKLEHFERLLEATDQCRSESTGGTASHTSMAPLQANAYDRALELATQKSRPLARQKKKRVATEPPSMESRTKSVSLKLVSHT